jgi:hypothetical protein
MPITQAFPNKTNEDLHNGVHLPGHTYKAALYTSSANLDATTTGYTATGEVTGTGYTAGGATLTGRSVIQNGGKSVLTFANPSWANSTITARGMLIYNDTVAGKPALGVYDFGSDVSSTNGTFTVQMPAQTAAAGLHRIA